MGEEHELSQPQIGQRCHVPGIGFGTIRKIEEREQEGLRTRVTTYLKIEFDARITRWKPLNEVELLQWSSQKQEDDPNSTSDIRYSDDPTYGQFSP